MVFGAIDCFGIKGAIGSDRLSEFFHLLQLESRIGCSASALRELEVQVKTQIIADGAAQTAAHQGPAPIGICVGADETFYGLPILGAVALASGFIFSEVECANRTDETWWEPMSRWFNPEQWDCRMRVSDGAKALVKLALSGLGCPSLPDVFHLWYALSKSIGSTIARQQMRLEKQPQTLQSQLKTTAAPAALVDQIAALQTQPQTLETDHPLYQQSLHGLSPALHPFHLNPSEAQFGLELTAQWQVHLTAFAQLSQTDAPTPSQAAIALWQRQIPNLSGALHAWWQWVLQALPAQTANPDTQNWVLTQLLPWVYWHQQTQKTRQPQPQLKLADQQAAQQAQERFRADAFTLSVTASDQQRWIDWADLDVW